MASSVKGIFIAVELDQTALKKSVQNATDFLKKEFNATKEAIDGALDIDANKINSKFTSIARSIADIQNEIRVGSSGKGMFSSAISQSADLRREIDNIAKNAGVSADKIKSSFSRAFDAASIENVVNSFSRYAKLLQLSNKEAIAHAKELGIVGEALDRIEAKYSRMERGSFLTSLKNMVTTGNTMAAIQASIATLGANLSVAGAVELGKSMVSTTIQVDSLRTAFESIYKDSARAAAQLDYIRSVTNELGLEFYKTAEAAKGFFAASETSELKNDAEEIFHAFSSAISALKMTDEKGASVFLAISQMLSKGKVSAEEMRQQLGEHLPGAVQMLASAMGVSLQKLDKMFEAGEVGLENLLLLAREVEKVYGEAGAKAGNALLGQLNKLRSEWTDFKASFVDSREVTDLIENVRKGLSVLTDNIGEIRTGLISVGYGFAAAFSVTAMKGALVTLKAIYNTVRQISTVGSVGAGAFKGLSLFGVASTVGLAVTAVTEFWQVWNRGAEKAKYSVDDFKNGISSLSSDFNDLKEESDNATKSLQESIKIRMKARIDDLKSEIDESINSLKNAATAVQSEWEGTGSGVFKTFGMSREELTQWETQQRTIGEVYREMYDIAAMVKEGQLDYGDAAYFYDLLKEKLRDVGIIGGDTFKAINSAIGLVTKELPTLTNELDNSNAALNGVKKTAEELSKINPFQLFGNANDLKLDNLKKSAELAGDKQFSALLKYLTGGNAKNAEGKKPVIDADILKGAYDVYSASGLDIFDFAEKYYGLSEDITDALREQISLDKQLDDQRKNSSSTLSNRVRLEEDYAATLSGLVSKYNEMQKLQGLPMDSLERSLVEVDIRATELDTKLEKLKNKMIKDKVDPETMALIELYSKKVNEGEKQEDLAKTYQSFVEQAKSAWNEIAEANGLTNQIILDDTQKTYDDMEKALNEMYAMGRITAEEYAAYMIGINEQVARKRLELDTSWQAGLKQGAQEMQDETANYAKQWADVGKNAFTGLADALAEFATSTEKTWKSLGDAFSDLADSIVKDLARMATQAMASNLYSGLFGGASGGLLSGLVGSIGGLFGFADGGVMAPGSLSAYSNGVYSSPTYFSMTGAQRFAKGGVFGEAGPEAIMPLTTMPNGRLGVAATGVGGDVEINIINSTGEKVSTRQSNNTGGGKTIDVMIGDVVAKQMTTPGTKLNRSVTAQTGAKQSVIRR